MLLIHKQNAVLFRQIMSNVAWALHKMGPNNISATAAVLHLLILGCASLVSDLLLLMSKSAWTMHGMQPIAQQSAHENPLHSKILFCGLPASAE